MDSILIKGAKDSGKSTTIQEVCKRLQPQVVRKLICDTKQPSQSTVINDSLSNIFNHAFIITVNNKNILVVAGAPTEQNITVTVLVQCCIAIGITIDFAIVNMRSFEKRNGFDTPAELRAFGTIVLQRKIYRIRNNNYQQTKEWNDRVDEIVNAVNNNI